MTFDELFSLYKDQLNLIFSQMEVINSGLYGGESIPSGEAQLIVGTTYYWWSGPRPNFWFINVSGDDNSPNAAVELDEEFITVWGDDALGWSRQFSRNDIASINVVGQRRPAETSLPYPQNLDRVGQRSPCSSPAGRRDWNTDAAASAAAKAIDDFAKRTHPNESGISEREYGASLWELPDGSVVHGPITGGQYRFDQAHLVPSGRAGVTLDTTLPHPYARWIGTIHSHGSGGHILSGSNHGNDDQAMLTAIRDYRIQRGWDPDDARVYIYANDIEYENVTPIISVYDHRNRDAAIQGHRGPQVSPNAAPCP